jgi:hypothetical protein
MDAAGTEGMVKAKDAADGITVRINVCCEKNVAGV